MRSRDHRAQFTPALLAVLPVEWIAGRAVFDPFAAKGCRLGAWCDERSIAFSGFDLQAWPGRDPRVLQADATKADCYPPGQHIIVTSPTYGNGMNDHFRPKDPNRRDNTYRTWRGEDLHENNSGRYTCRHGGEKERRYWEINEAAVATWAARGFDAIVNVKTSFPVSKKMLDRFPSSDYPLAATWRELLERHGYATADTIEVSAGLDAVSDEPAVSSADAIALLIEHAHVVQGRDLEPYPDVSPIDADEKRHRPRHQPLPTHPPLPRLAPRPPHRCRSPRRRRLTRSHEDR
jgi:hypothetical protein